jgi:hypothetical protein
VWPRAVMHHPGKMSVQGQRQKACWSVLLFRQTQPQTY